MPGAAAHIGRIEDADIVLYSGTALIKDVVNNFLRGRRTGHGSGTVVAVLLQKLSDTAVVTVNIGISDTLCDKSHTDKAFAACLQKLFHRNYCPHR